MCQAISLIDFEGWCTKKVTVKKEAKLLQRDKSLMSRKTMPGFFVCFDFFQPFLFSTFFG